MHETATNIKYKTQFLLKTGIYVPGKLNLRSAAHAKQNKVSSKFFCFFRKQFTKRKKKKHKNIESLHSYGLCVMWIEDFEYPHLHIYDTPTPHTSAVTEFCCRYKKKTFKQQYTLEIDTSISFLYFGEISLFSFFLFTTGTGI